MHARVVYMYILGAGKVSCLERCPQFRSVLIEGFHCTCVVCMYIYYVCIVCVYMCVILCTCSSI